jgi:hypothetical protein
MQERKWKQSYRGVTKLSASLFETWREHMPKQFKRRFEPWSRNQPSHWKKLATSS